MGPTWGRQDPGGPHVGLMNLTTCIWGFPLNCRIWDHDITSYNGGRRLAVTAVATEQNAIKSVQLIWKSGTRYLNWVAVIRPKDTNNPSIGLLGDTPYALAVATMQTLDFHW